MNVTVFSELDIKTSLKRHYSLKKTCALLAKRI